jgi:uncharacterized protein (DUF1684 family)
LAGALELAGWRREVSELYAAVRNAADPAEAHALWRRRRDDLFLGHPQSPLPEDDFLRATGLPYFPYDPALRFEVPVQPAARPETLALETSDGLVRLDLIGRIAIPELGFGLDVWQLAQYGGGLFVPLRDGTAGAETYGGGRYLLDTAKGADLGGQSDRLIVDFNFLYHPSCRYSSAWACPLAPEGNTTRVPIRGGERL